MNHNPLPREFYCPLSGKVLKDPMVDADGNVYSREAILEYLAENQASPITKRKMASSELKPQIPSKSL